MEKLLAVVLGTMLPLLSSVTLADNTGMERPPTPAAGATEETVVKPAVPPEVKTQEKQEHELTPEQEAAVAKVLQGIKPPETHVGAAVQAAAAKLAQQECALCHGTRGQSVSPTFPRLAGQRAAYIQEELMEFREESRRDPDAQAFMWGMASQLNNEIIEALGHYYENLEPVAPEAADAKLTSAGKALFDEGIPASGIPACQLCHGTQAHGIGPLPRLAGQHVAYLVKQMRSFKNGLRVNPVMEPITQAMTSEQMQDVANYLASLP